MLLREWSSLVILLILSLFEKLVENVIQSAIFTHNWKFFVLCIIAEIAGRMMNLLIHKRDELAFCKTFYNIREWDELHKWYMYDIYIYILETRKPTSNQSIPIRYLFIYIFIYTRALLYQIDFI